MADSHRASAEITAAHQVGVFQGYGDGTFRPDGKLTRGQAELVIHRMLTWQGTDDDGNFEISRADAAVLAMSGLCGLDPDRIPACAAVSEAEVQAAYNRGFDDGLDAATPTGSTPPPVTEPPEPPTGSTPTEPPPEPQPRFKARVVTNNWPVGSAPRPPLGRASLYSRPYGDGPQGIFIEITDVRGQKIAGQTVSWWATGVHEPATSTPPMIGPKTITTNSNGTAVFYLTQPDPDADGDNKTTWTYKIKVGDDVDLEDNLSIGFTVNGDTGTGSIIFDEHDELRLSIAPSWQPHSRQLGIVLAATIDGSVQSSLLNNVKVFADFDGDDQFGCSDLHTYNVGEGNVHWDCRGGPVTSVDDQGEIGGTIVGSVYQAGGAIGRILNYSPARHRVFTVSGGYARGSRGSWAPASVQSGGVTYRFAADLNGDGDVTDSGEMTSMTFFWPELDGEP